MSRHQLSITRLHSLSANSLLNSYSFVFDDVLWKLLLTEIYVYVLFITCWWYIFHIYCCAIFAIIVFLKAIYNFGNLFVYLFQSDENSVLFSNKIINEPIGDKDGSVSWDEQVKKPF